MAEPARDDGRPPWARRIRRERAARGWSQRDAAEALRAHSSSVLPGNSGLLRSWKRWEAGDAEPDAFYKPLIAKTFGTVTAAFFAVQRHDDLVTGTGMDTLEIVARLRASDVSPATLDALRITADRLCSEYPYRESGQLVVEGRSWLRMITDLLDRRLTLAQHQEVLALAGTVALLVGCVEYDMGLRPQAESTRRAALTLGEESGRADVMGWANEMRAWFALTQGDLRGAVAAAEIGEAIAPHDSVAVQLIAQRAKAWARLGDRRQVELALDQGRRRLEAMPHPDNLDHHFVVDPAKFDFYAMDCYRILGEDSLAELYADEVIRDGIDRKPMRVAEARITLGVAAARAGDMSKAIGLGELAIQGDRRSLPSLTMVAQDLAAALTERFPNERGARDYTEHLRSL